MLSAAGLRGVGVTALNKSTLAGNNLRKRRETNMATTQSAAFTRRDLEIVLIEKCWKDPEFKRQVVSDPKGVLERHTGQKLPRNVRIFIHEEDANTLHLSIPLAPSNLAELSDADLEKVAGGTDVALSLAVTLPLIGVTVGAGTAAGTLAAAGKSPW